MKTIKLSFVALAILVMGTFVFTGCSDEGSTVAPVDSQVLKSRIIDEGAFLAEFYEGIPWERRRTVIARDSLNTYVITEIILEGDTRARGYLVKDEATGELLHFADVDRTGYVLKIVDLITEEREVITDINLYPDYGLTHEFDVIQIIDDGDYGYVVNGFYTYGACAPNNVGGGCSAGVYYTKTFLFFKGKEKAVQNSRGGNAYTPCNCSTGEVTPYNPNA